MVLARLAKRARIESGSSLADALDLLVVSVEAGLGLDQALTRVGSELAFAYPDLSDELRLVNLELRAGKPRVGSAAESRRPDRRRRPSSLVTMLIQTDKFGTSVAQSLRVYSETLRTKRRQRAEEAAAKTGVKMVFPLVFCIFPAIWVVTIGPAAIKFITVLFPMIEKSSSDAMSVDRRRVRQSARSRRRRRRAARDPRRDRACIPTRCRAAAAEDAGRRRGERHGSSPRRCGCRIPMLDALSSTRAIEKLVEVRGASGAGTAGYRYALTDLGRDRAQAVLRHQPLRRPGAGAARAVQRLRPRVHGARGRSSIASACATASSTDRQRRGCSTGSGPAVNSGKSLFLYGAPGNGKTVIAEGIGRALGDEMHIPHAIDVDGQTITMFDPVNHDADCGPSAASTASSPPRARSPLGEDPAAGRRGRRRADSRDARSDLQSDREILRSADPAQGERRRVRRRRLRPSADAGRATC